VSDTFKRNNPLSFVKDGLRMLNMARETKLCDHLVPKIPKR